MPETLWKEYIDFEINENEYINVRKLYERLLNKTTHVKVWISYAQFECNLITMNDSNTNLNEITEESKLLVRNVLKRGYELLKSQNLKEERILLLENWRNIEIIIKSNINTIKLIEDKFPRKIKMRRQLTDETNVNAVTDNYEEYYEYQFPDDENKIVGLKLLENAMKWKLAAANAAALKTNEENEITSGDLSGIMNTNTNTNNNKRKYNEENENELNLLQTNERETKRMAMTTMNYDDDNEIDIDG